MSAESSNATGVEGSSILADPHSCTGVFLEATADLCGATVSTEEILDFGDTSTSSASEWGLDPADDEASSTEGNITTASAGELLRGMVVAGQQPVLDMEHLLHALLLQEGLIDEKPALGGDLQAAAAGGGGATALPGASRMHACGTSSRRAGQAEGAAALLGSTLYAYESRDVTGVHSACGVEPTSARPACQKLRSVPRGFTFGTKQAEGSTEGGSVAEAETLYLASPSSVAAESGGTQPGSAARSFLSLSSSQLPEELHGAEELRLLAGPPQQWQQQWEEEGMSRGTSARGARCPSATLPPEARLRGHPAGIGIGGGPRSQVSHASGAGAEQEEEEEQSVFSVVALDSANATPRDSTAQDDALEAASSTWGLGETTRSATSTARSDSMQHSARTILSEYREAAPSGEPSNNNAVESLTGILQQLAMENISLDDGLARSIHRVLQLGTALAGQRLTDDEIRALPKVRFETTEQQSCSICLEAYHRGEVLTALRCAHFFHVDCLGRWFQHSTQCPLCRSPCAD